MNIRDLSRPSLGRYIRISECKAYAARANANRERRLISPHRAETESDIRHIAERGTRRKTATRGCERCIGARDVLTHEREKNER